MNKSWLPKGHHYDLHIERGHPAGAPVPFTGGGWKIVWHTTEGANFDAMDAVLRSKHAEPHFLIGLEPGRQHYSVLQYFPLNVGGRALEHPAGTMPTNSANAIQIEVCGFAREAHTWDDDMMHALAQLTRLIEHRVEVLRKAPRPFKVPALHYSQQGFVQAKGHVGHCHVPNNEHWDPGRLPWSRIKRRIEQLED